MFNCRYLRTEKTLTVFTPTFNRAYCLHIGYEALKRQTCKDFKWLIIDDGSTDNTKELVDSWIAEGIVEIEYHYKENGGMHTGHNKAYELISTELNVCIDSDDYMPDNAIELIINKWNNFSDKSYLAGMIGLDAFKNGKITGNKIPDNLIKGSLDDLYQKYNVTGDKKIVLRTDVVKKYPPYPEYDKERLVPLDILYLIIGKDYDFVYDNSIYCIVEYLEDGSSKNIFKQYTQSPRGFAYARKIQIKYSNSLLYILKNYVHLVSSALFAKNLSIAFHQTNPLLVIFALPFGLILNLFIRINQSSVSIR